MNRPERPVDPEIGVRLDVAIKIVFGTHKAMAERVGITEQSISRYVGGDRLPAGEEMVKLAQALPGWMDWILTGRDRGDVERWVSALSQLTDDERASIQAYARVLASRNRMLIRHLPDDIHDSDEILRAAQRMVDQSP